MTRTTHRPVARARPGVRLAMLLACAMAAAWAARLVPPATAGALPDGPVSTAAAGFRAAGSRAADLPGAQRPAMALRPAGDSPAGFWYGTDSRAMPVTGTGPYHEPVIGGAYGGYVGMVGNWARWQGCHGALAWSSVNFAQAAADFATYHLGIGTAAYWFMAGPGVDPRYNGTVAEAAAWGRAQAARALFDIHGSENYPVVWMDVELPGHAPAYTPAPDNGWNAVYTAPCSGKVRSSYIAPAVDRAVLDGFASYLTSHSRYQPGVYSAPSIWPLIFGNGAPSQIAAFYEWTYTQDTSSLASPPSGWCLRGTSTCAAFFGGDTSASAKALMWQWSGGGGTSNGYGDFDQIDANRTP